jgi:enoyl-CoA hydratase
MAEWREGLTESAASPFAGTVPADHPQAYRTLTYEVTGRIARIMFDRPETGNAITADTPFELAAAVERADRDPRVHVILVAGRGPGFCSGYDLDVFAERADQPVLDDEQRAGTALDPRVTARNHDPAGTWDPMVDYALMSRFTRCFASLLHADKPTVAKLHGFCVGGGADIALHADQIIAAADTKIGYPPARVWGVPSAGLWAHRLGDQRAKRLLFTGDSFSGAEAAAWGVAVEAPAPQDLDERTEILLERISQVPVNQLMMVKLALNSALLAQGVATSATIGTVFDGIARHTREGYAFRQRAAEVGFRQAVRERDEPFGDHGRSTHRG